MSRRMTKQEPPLQQTALAPARGRAVQPPVVARNLVRALLVAGMAATLAGCAGLAGRSPGQQAALPQPGIPERLPVAASAEEAALPSWTDWLGQDQALQRLVTIARANNRDLRIALLNVQRAQAQFQAAEASRWPSLGLGGGVQRTPNNSGKQVNSFTAGVQMPAWEIDAFGRLQSLSDAARAQWLASQAGQRVAGLALDAQVVQMALALRADARLLTLAQRTLASREDSLRLVRLREAAGAASALELRAQEGLVAQARATLAALQRQRAQDEQALALLLGQPVPVELLADAASAAGASPAADEATLLARFADVPVGLSARVLLRRPDVVQAEQQLLAARANLGAARAALWPSITLTAQAGQASGQLSGLFEGGHFAYSLAANLLFTVFDAGRREAAISAADSSERIALAQYERTVQAAFRDTADALTAVATWRQQQAALRDGLAAARETARLVRLKFEHGAASALEQLEAERGLWSAEQALVQARLAELSAQVALYKALAP